MIKFIFLSVTFFTILSSLSFAQTTCISKTLDSSYNIKSEALKNKFKSLKLNIIYGCDQHKNQYSIITTTIQGVEKSTDLKIESRDFGFKDLVSSQFIKFIEKNLNFYCERMEPALRKLAEERKKVVQNNDLDYLSQLDQCRLQVINELSNSKPTLPECSI